MNERLNERTARKMCMCLGTNGRTTLLPSNRAFFFFFFILRLHFFFVFFVHVSANTRWTRNISNSRARWYTIQNIIIDYLYHFIEFFFTCSGAVIKISRSRCRTLSAASNWRRHVNCGMRRRQLFSVRTKSESDLFTIDSTKYMRGNKTSAASEPIDHSCRIISVSMPQNKQ